MEWSMMMPELLETIAQKHNLYYEDYLSFASVCKSWQSAAKDAIKIKGHCPDGPPSRFPSLLLAEQKEVGAVRELFFLSNKTVREVQLPETSGKLCMSSCGWLLTIGDDCAAKLIRPLSEEIINLPKVDTFPDFLEHTEWDRGIRKLVLPNPSPSSLLVVVLWGCSGKIGFCRPGDNKWTPVQEGWGGQIFDITYHNGRVYSFDCNYHIRACDVYGKDPTTMVKVSRLPKDLYNGWLGGAYIVGGGSEEEHDGLMVVIREGMHDNVEDELCPETYKTKSFRVFKYGLESEKWLEVKDLGRRALFVGFNSSFWINEDTTGVIKGNCIYYTDDVLELYHASIKGGGRDMGVYHLCDGTIHPHYIGESRSHLTPPIWVQPM